MNLSKCSDRNNNGEYCCQLSAQRGTDFNTAAYANEKLVMTDDIIYYLLHTWVVKVLNNAKQIHPLLSTNSLIASLQLTGH